MESGSGPLAYRSGSTARGRVALRRLTGEHIVEADLIQTWVPAIERKASSMAHLVAIANQKGGVAKTTTSIHLSAGLAQRGFRVLAVDVDPQANLTSGLDIDIDPTKGSIVDALREIGGSLEPAIHTSKVSGLDVVPSDIELADIELQLVSRINREKVIVRAIPNSVRASYDFIVMDAPPNLGTLTVAVLMASQTLVIPVVPEFYSLKGMKSLTRHVNEVRSDGNILQNQMVLITRVRNTSLATEVQAAVRELSHQGVFPPVCDTAIKEVAKIAEAASQGVPVYQHAPTHEGSEMYLRFTDEFLQRIGVQSPIAAGA